MQIVPARPPVACNMDKLAEICMRLALTGTIFMRLAATQIQFACKWRPLGYKTRDKRTRGVQKAVFRSHLSIFSIDKSTSSTHASNFSADGPWIGFEVWKMHYGTMDDIATWKQILHVLAASCMQSRQFFASTLREQLIEFKNEDAIKKSENLRDTCLL
jgi:hypothetical protein